MSSKKQEVYHFYREITNHKLPIKELSILTSKSYQQCQRLVKKVKDKGMLGVIHGNFGKVTS